MINVDTCYYLTKCVLKVLNFLGDFTIHSHFRKKEPGLFPPLETLMIKVWSCCFFRCRWQALNCQANFFRFNISGFKLDFSVMMLVEKQFADFIHKQSKWYGFMGCFCLLTCWSYSSLWIGLLRDQKS